MTIMQNNSLKAATIILGAFLIITACSKQSIDTPDSVTQVSSFSLMQDKILTPTCATSGCHASTSDGSFKQHGLVLEKSVAYENLVGITPVNLLSKADGHLRVKAFKSLESLFYHKLTWDATHHGGKQYGLPMPLGSTALSVGQIEFVRRWIEAGAPKVGEVADAKLLDDKTPSVSVIDNFKAMSSPKTEGVDGFQLKVDKFEVAPNFERELFVRRMVGNTAEIYINRIKLQSRPNSHHMVLYDYRSSANLPVLDVVRDLRNPDNALNYNTVLQMSNHIFLGGGTQANQEYVFPEGTALLLPPNYSMDLNPHYFNKTNTVLYGENYVNLYTTPKSNVKYVVKTIDFNNLNFMLPANKVTVISTDFTFKTNVKIVSLTSHTHQYGEKYVIKILGGARNGEIVYENLDWEHPLVKNFSTPITLKKGEGLTSVVTYNNKTNKQLNFGLTSDDEMNIIFGYYYEE
jgi:Copper type II ascorbate-dependent monooxygenase, C-terminal domain